jgi:mannose-1-phosphate guanylyltransferase
VVGFTEKPDEKTAKQLIENGALWNCGVFAMKIGYILESAKKYIDPDSYEAILEQYGSLPRISFDYEIVEHEKSIGLATYEGYWKDLGTWNTLTEEMKENVVGENVLLSDSCKDVHILNMLNIPIIVLGLKNAVVVASHDGILVTDKCESSFLKPFAEQIKLRPMYERRQWGDYRVLDYIQNDGGSSLTKRIRVNAGKSISYQYHSERSEIWVIINGKGIITIDGVDSLVAPGSIVQIPIGTKHKLLAATDLEFIEVQLGNSELREEDIVRII